MSQQAPDTQLPRSAEALLEAIKDELSGALQGDLEHGVAWMNDEAAAEFVKKYPRLNEALNKVFAL